MPKHTRNGLTILNTTNESYELLETLGGGASSTVYLARCIRGRLYGQRVALKEMVNNRKTVHLAESTALHTHLQHPNIIALLSAFEDGPASYHVLELCGGGTLADMIRSSSHGRLSEAQVKSVVKDLVHALLYLRKERVVHRDIKAGNVLVTDDGSVKLADFGLAEWLPGDGTVNTFCGSPNYVAPEIVRRVPYSFAVDIWSLGCLILTCLNGVPPFEAASLDGVFDNVCNAVYSLPRGTSPEISNLIASLLQIDPRKRIPLHCILSHPFFASTELVESVHTLGSAKSATTLPKHSRDRPAAKIANPDAVLRNRPAGPVTHDIAPLPKGTKALVKPFIKGDDARRSVSDPIPRRPTVIGASKPRVCSLAEDFAALNVQPRPKPLARGRHIPRTVTSPAPCEPPTPPSPSPGPEYHDSIAEPSSVRRAPLSLRTALEDYKSVVIAGGPRWPSSPDQSDEPEPELHRGRYQTLGVGPIRRRPKAMLPTPSVSPPPVPPAARNRGRSPSPPQAVKNRCLSRSPTPARNYGDRSSSLPLRRSSSPVQPDDSMITALPIGTTRPKPLTTAPLRAQTHRVGQGKLSISISGDLLVDFRDDNAPVMYISADGRSVRVETLEDVDGHVWKGSPEDMPRRWWKVWNDAAKLVERLKARTPRMVVYDANVKWTRMANEPHADVEGLFIRRSEKKGKERPTMRVRFARRTGVVEVAKMAGGEWTTMRGTLSDLGRDQQEKAAMEGLRAFVRACERVEDENGMFYM